jgi:DNA-binding PadR family transcriptional regulator
METPRLVMSNLMDGPLRSGDPVRQDIGVSLKAADLTQAGYLILLSLASGPAHGYRIMQMINSVFRTDLKIGPGTLYRTLQRLSSAGLIEDIETDSGDGERRRAYRLTGPGAAAARDEMRRLDLLVRLAKVQLSANGSVGADHE